jgi:glycosyltransferase involved in cell wall biosynthesis
LKILILQDDFAPYEKGGAGVMTNLMAKGFVSAGQEVFVITTVQDKKLAGDSVENGMKVYRIYSDYHERWRSYLSLYNPSVIGRVRELMKEIKPDVIHAHNIHYYLSYNCLKIARQFTDKVYLTAHDIMSFYPGTFTEFIDKKDLSCPKGFNYKVNFLMLIRAFTKRYNPFRNILVRYYLSKTKKIIAVSEALKQALNQNGIGNCAVIHNGIDYSTWNVSESGLNNFRQKYNLIDRDIVLFGGRLSGAKGGSLIIEAMNKVIKNNSKAILFVIGNKDFYAEKMLKQSESLSVKDNIIFSGWLDREQIKFAYNSANVVVIPSVCFDSFPNGNLEAFASKKPVIATCFGGSKEIVRDGENGYIVNPFDVERLAQKIDEILSDKNKEKAFGESGYSLVSADFTQENMVKKYLSLFFE